MSHMSLISNPLPRHPNPHDRDEVIVWARQLLSKKDFVILDTETTGLGHNDEVVQIGVIDHAGIVLMNTLVKPVKNKTMPKRAQEVHGITMKMLKNAPTLAEILPELSKVINNRIVICYNSEFDLRMLEQSASFFDPDFELDYRNDCAMLAYSQFVGTPNKFYNGYAWQRLPRPTQKDHRAVEDCHLTLELIKNLADAHLQGETLDFNVASAPVPASIVRPVSPEV